MSCSNIIECSLCLEEYIMNSPQEDGIPVINIKVFLEFQTANTRSNSLYIRKIQMSEAEFKKVGFRKSTLLQVEGE